MKPLITFLLALSSFGAAAQTVELKSGNKDVALDGVATTAGTHKTYSLNLTFSLTGPIPAAAINQTVRLQSFAGSLNPQFVTNPGTGALNADLVVSFAPTEFVAGKKEVIRTVLIDYELPTKALASTEVAYLRIGNAGDYFKLSFSQKTAEAKLTIVPEPAVLAPYVSDTADRVRDNTIALKIKRSGNIMVDTAKETTFKLNLRTTGNKVKLSFYPDNTIKIGKDDAARLNKNETITKYVILRMNHVSAKEKLDAEFNFINVEGDETAQMIEVSDRGRYNPNKPFWVEVGANFDLVDGLQANNVFTGVFLLKRDIRPLRRYKPINESQRKSAVATPDSLRVPNDNKVLGLFAGVFESKTISNVAEESEGTRTYYNQQSLALKKGDSVSVFKDKGTIKKVQTVRNIGLFFSPQIRISRGSADNEGLHFFTSLWFEMQWQRIALENNFSEMTRNDTTFIHKNDITKYAPKDGKIEFDLRSHYFGGGLPIFFKEGTTNVFINPVVGFSNQPKATILEEALANPGTRLNREWKPFYVVQFRLSEEHYGFAFSGEVRGLISKNSPPFVTLAFTKKFDLSKFIEFGGK